jgi:hypothetical protein
MQNRILRLRCPTCIGRMLPPIGRSRASSHMPATYETISRTTIDGGWTVRYRSLTRGSNLVSIGGISTLPSRLNPGLGFSSPNHRVRDEEQVHPKVLPWNRPSPTFEDDRRVHARLGLAIRPPDRYIRAAPIRNALEPLANKHQISFANHLPLSSDRRKSCPDERLCSDLASTLYFFFREGREHAPYHCDGGYPSQTCPSPH